MGGIEIITGRIAREAAKEADGIIDEAEKNAAALTAEYEKKAAEIVAKAHARAEKDAAADFERAVASSKTTTRNAVLQAKSGLIDKAFAEAYEKLLSAGESETRGMLCSMLSKTVGAQAEFEEYSRKNDSDGDHVACEVYEIMLNARDREKFGKALLDFAAGELAGCGKTIKLSENDADIGGGFILVCGDIQIDCSLSALVNSQRSGLEASVLAELFR